jgi:hypothetical protein
MKALQAFETLAAFAWIHREVHEELQPGDVVESVLRFEPAACQVQIISVTIKLICSGSNTSQ